MTPYLLANANPHGDHFYRSRRRPILAQVIHITAGLEDLDLLGIDHSAEQTARYAATTARKVSWHSGSDTDSAFDLLPDEFTAFHVEGYNSPTLGHEISKWSPDWRPTSKRARDRLLLNAARHLAPKAVRHGIPIRKATRAELDAAIAHYERTGEARPVGFIGHWELDPTRRSDPGLVRAHNLDTFPWHEFLDLVRFHAAPQSQEDPELMHALMIVTAYIEAGYDIFDKKVARSISKWLRVLADTIAAGGDPMSVVNDVRKQLPDVPVEPVWS